MNKQKKQVGVIGVDAGICWIGDPCYILHNEDGLPKEVGKNWREFVDILYTKSRTNIEAHQFNYDLGHAGLGVVVSTGYGDGVYPVFIETEDNRVKRVSVEFF